MSDDDDSLTTAPRALSSIILSLRNLLLSPFLYSTAQTVRFTTLPAVA